MLGNQQPCETSIIIPKGTKSWYFSIKPNKSQEKDNILMFTWSQLSENLYVTYGLPVEYLFYDNKVSSIKNDFMVIVAILLTILIAFTIYYKQSPENNHIINYLFIIWGFILIILTSIFLLNTQGLILPFYKQYITGILVRFLITSIILIIIYLLTKIKFPKK